MKTSVGKTVDGNLVYILGTKKSRYSRVSFNVFIMINLVYYYFLVLINAEVDTGFFRGYTLPVKDFLNACDRSTANQVLRRRKKNLMRNEKDK